MAVAPGVKLLDEPGSQANGRVVEPVAQGLRLGLVDLGERPFPFAPLLNGFQVGLLHGRYSFRLKVLRVLRGHVVEVNEHIPAGHKIALRDIAAGEEILKYGEPIGIATNNVAEYSALIRALEEARDPRCVFTYVYADMTERLDRDLDHYPLVDPDWIVALAEGYRAVTIVDDSHGTGVLGPTGRGTIEHFGLHGRVDIVTGTLGKALGGAAAEHVGPGFAADARSDPVEGRPRTAGRAAAPGGPGPRGARPRPRGRPPAAPAASRRATTVAACDLAPRAAPGRPPGYPIPAAPPTPQIVSRRPAAPASKPAAPPVTRSPPWAGGSTLSRPSTWS